MDDKDPPQLEHPKKKHRMRGSRGGAKNKKKQHAVSSNTDHRDERSQSNLKHRIEKTEAPAISSPTFGSLHSGQRKTVNDQSMDPEKSSMALKTSFTKTHQQTYESEKTERFNETTPLEKPCQSSFAFANVSNDIHTRFSLLQVSESSYEPSLNSSHRATLESRNGSSVSTQVVRPSNDRYSEPSEFLPPTALGSIHSTPSSSKLPYEFSRIHSVPTRRLEFPLETYSPLSHFEPNIEVMAYDKYTAFPHENAYELSNNHIAPPLQTLSSSRQNKSTSIMGPYHRTSERQVLSQCSRPTEYRHPHSLPQSVYVAPDSWSNKKNSHDFHDGTSYLNRYESIHDYSSHLPISASPLEDIGSSSPRGTYDIPITRLDCGSEYPVFSTQRAFHESLGSLLAQETPRSSQSGFHEPMQIHSNRLHTAPLSNQISVPSSRQGASDPYSIHSKPIHTSSSEYETYLVSSLRQDIFRQENNDTVPLHISTTLSNVGPKTLDIYSQCLQQTRSPTQRSPDPSCASNDECAGILPSWSIESDVNGNITVSEKKSDNRETTKVPFRLSALPPIVSNSYSSLRESTYGSNHSNALASNISSTGNKNQHVQYTGALETFYRSYLSRLPLQSDILCNNNIWGPQSKSSGENSFFDLTPGAFLFGEQDDSNSVNIRK